MVIEELVVKEIFKKFREITTRMNNNEIISICSYCQKVKHDDGWFKYPYNSQYERYSHGICPDDYNKMMDEL